MKKSTLARVLAVLIIATLLFTACAPATTAAPTQVPAESTKPAVATATVAPNQPTNTVEAAATATMAPPTPAGPYENVDPTGQKITFWHVHSKARQDLLQSTVIP